MRVRYHILSHLIYLVYQGLFPTKLNHWYYLFSHICTRVTYKTKKLQRNQGKQSSNSSSAPLKTLGTLLLVKDYVIKCQLSIPYTLPFCAMFLIVKCMEKIFLNFFSGAVIANLTGKPWKLWSIGWMDRGGSNNPRTNGPGVHLEVGSNHATTPSL